MTMEFIRSLKQLQQLRTNKDTVTQLFGRTMLMYLFVPVRDNVLARSHSYNDVIDENLVILN